VSANPPVGGVDRLVADFQSLVSEAESILESAANDSGEAANTTRERIREALAQAREQIERIESKLMIEARVAALAADRYVHERPWQAVGVAAAVGFVIGVVVSRK